MGNRKVIKLSAAAKNRLAAIERLQKGESQRDVAKAFGVHQTTIGEWLRIYQEEGPAGLNRPTKPRPKHELSAEQIRLDLETLPEKYQQLNSLLDLANGAPLNKTAQKFSITAQALAKRRREYLAGLWHKKKRVPDAKGKASGT